MAIYQTQIFNHFKHVESWLKPRGVRADVRLPGLILQIQYRNLYYEFQPQFLVKDRHGKLSMWMEFGDSSASFCGWLPYFNKRWPEAISKLAFKEFALRNGLRCPAHNVLQGSYRDVIIKRDRSSFAEGIRGPFRVTTTDSDQARLTDGEYYETFILGRPLKAWYWNGKIVAAELEEMASVVGDGTHKVRDILALGRYMRRPVPQELLESMLAYQGWSLDAVLPAGEAVYVDYRYDSPLHRLVTDNQDVLHQLPQHIRSQLDEAGPILLDSIPDDIRNNTAFSVDAVVDKDDSVWFLEMNCNPGLHPAIYPAMFDSLFEGADIVSDEYKPRHLLANPNRMPTVQS
ncbi:MAG: hypothetical protein HYU78_14150 [Rhodocyclales bacterium]|nr:hypothetical protein [Rhodocyclales bacterium]